MPCHNATLTISGRWAVKLLVEIFKASGPRFQVNIREYVLLWSDSKAGARQPFALPAEPIIHP
jgi:hypothetical protein